MTNIIQEIDKLKKAKNAIILAHYYQLSEVQAIADFVGDSLELSKIAKDNDKSIILFCGVNFMAGSAKLLSPEKKVLLPKFEAGCPMADMATPEKVLEYKAHYPKAKIVTYINSSVDVKTVSDICCTSSNAVKVVKSLDTDEIIFVPDKNLGAYVSRFTDKKIILYDGHCPVHNDITVDDVEKAKGKYPGALVLVHPECPSEVIDAADYCGSTSNIINHVGDVDNEDFIIGTEEGILYTLERKYPNKNFHIMTNDFICEDMKKITIKDVYEALLYEKNEIVLSDETIQQASICLNRMLDLF